MRLKSQEERLNELFRESYVSPRTYSKNKKEMEKWVTQEKRGAEKAAKIHRKRVVVHNGRSEEDPERP